MNSKICKSIDDGGILQTNMNNYDVVERVQEQYGESQYGSVKYTANELFLAYHTLDPSQAIERIWKRKIFCTMMKENCNDNIQYLRGFEKESE